MNYFTFEFVASKLLRSSQGLVVSVIQAPFDSSQEMGVKTSFIRLHLLFCQKHCSSHSYIAQNL